MLRKHYSKETIRRLMVVRFVLSHLVLAVSYSNYLFEQ